jgi:hypothetical protein
LNRTSTLQALTLGAALLAPAAAVPQSAAAQRAHAAPIQSLVLSSADVSRYFGSGFSRSLATKLDQKTVSIAEQTQKLAGNTYVKHGFRAGFVSTFKKSKGLTQFKNGKLTLKPGVNEVSSDVLQFKDASGPRWEFAYTLTHLPQSKMMKIATHSLPGVGDQAVIETTSQKLGAPLGTVDAISITWRRNAYTATLTVAGYDSLKTTNIVDVAKALDKRLATSG